MSSQDAAVVMEVTHGVPYKETEETERDDEIENCSDASSVSSSAASSSAADSSSDSSSSDSSSSESGEDDDSAGEGADASPQPKAAASTAAAAAQSASVASDEGQSATKRKAATGIKRAAPAADLKGTPASKRRRRTAAERAEAAQAKKERAEARAAKKLAHEQAKAAKAIEVQAMKERKAREKAEREEQRKKERLLTSAQREELRVKREKEKAERVEKRRVEAEQRALKKKEEAELKAKRAIERAEAKKQRDMEKEKEKEVQRKKREEEKAERKRREEEEKKKKEIKTRPLTSFFAPKAEKAKKKTTEETSISTVDTASSTLTNANATMDSATAAPASMEGVVMVDATLATDVTESSSSSSSGLSSPKQGPVAKFRPYRAPDGVELAPVHSREPCSVCPLDCGQTLASTGFSWLVSQRGRKHAPRVRTSTVRPTPALPSWIVSNNSNNNNNSSKSVIDVDSDEQQQRKQQDEEDVAMLDAVVSSVKLRAPTYKLLQFHTNVRPPYFGTWTQKRSDAVGPRRPFAMELDTTVVDYDYDSEEDWEEDEGGESLAGSEVGDDEEDVGGEDELEDGFVVPHGYLSADEGLEEDDEEGGGGDSAAALLAAGSADLPVTEADRKRNAKVRHWETEAEMAHAPKAIVLVGPLWQSQEDRVAGKAILKRSGQGNLSSDDYTALRVARSCEKLYQLRGRLLMVPGTNRTPDGTYEEEAVDGKTGLTGGDAATGTCGGDQGEGGDGAEGGADALKGKKKRTPRVKNESPIQVPLDVAAQLLRHVHNSREGLGSLVEHFRKDHPAAGKGAIEKTIRNTAVKGQRPKERFKRWIVKPEYIERYKIDLNAFGLGGAKGLPKPKRTPTPKTKVAAATSATSSTATGESAATASAAASESEPGDVEMTPVTPGGEAMGVVTPLTGASNSSNEENKVVSSSGSVTSRVTDAAESGSPIKSMEGLDEMADAPQPMMVE